MQKIEDGTALYYCMRKVARYIVTRARVSQVVALLCPDVYYGILKATLALPSVYTAAIANLHTSGILGT